MFVLAKNRLSIILGPMEYSKRYFQSVVKDDLDLDINFPSSVSGYTDLGSGLEIFSVTVVQPSYNSKIEQLAGPFFTFLPDNTVVADFNIVPKNIEVVKSDLKALAASQRYNKEIGGVDVTIQGKTVKALTGREDRNLYLQALQLGAANISWKFDVNTWLTLSLAELGDIVTAVMNHVKTCFEEEATKAIEIDSCTSLAQLNDVIFENQQIQLPI